MKQVKFFRSMKIHKFYLWISISFFIACLFIPTEFFENFGLLTDLHIVSGQQSENKCVFYIYKCKGTQRAL